MFWFAITQGVMIDQKRSTNKSYGGLLINPMRQTWGLLNLMHLKNTVEKSSMSSDSNLVFDKQSLLSLSDEEILESLYDYQGKLIDTQISNSSIEEQINRLKKIFNNIECLEIEYNAGFMESINSVLGEIYIKKMHQWVINKNYRWDQWLEGVSDFNKNYSIIMRENIGMYALGKDIVLHICLMAAQGFDENKNMKNHYFIGFVIEEFKLLSRQTVERGLYVDAAFWHLFKTTYLKENREPNKFNELCEWATPMLLTGGINQTQLSEHMLEQLAGKMLIRHDRYWEYWQFDNLLKNRNLIFLEKNNHPWI